MLAKQGRIEETEREKDKHGYIAYMGANPKPERQTAINDKSFILFLFNLISRFRLRLGFQRGLLLRRRGRALPAGLALLPGGVRPALRLQVPHQGQGGGLRRGGHQAHIHTLQPARTVSVSI